MWFGLTPNLDLTISVLCLVLKFMLEKFKLTKKIYMIIHNIYIYPFDKPVALPIPKKKTFYIKININIHK